MRGRSDGTKKIQLMRDKDWQNKVRNDASWSGALQYPETAHAVSFGMELASELDKTKVIVVNISGLGDKDMLQVAKELDINLEDDTSWKIHPHAQ